MTEFKPIQSATNLAGTADVVVVGGGPAGLSAAVYLGRFRRNVVVMDAGAGRARLISRSHNCLGFPEGISGNELLRRLTAQAHQYGATLVKDQVESIERDSGGFLIQGAQETIRARKVILATGIVDIAPDMPRIGEAITKGSVRLCPVCDGYEAIDKHVAVVGPEESALKEAEFLQQYTAHVAILANCPRDVSSGAREQAAAQNIEILDHMDSLTPTEAGCDVILEDGSKVSFDVIYPAMGCNVRSELALSLGVRCSDDGYVIVDEHQRTSAEGVYAIGDVVKALNQIAVAFGQAAIAATDVHSQLSSEGLSSAGSCDNDG